MKGGKKLKNRQTPISLSEKDREMIEELKNWIGTDSIAAVIRRCIYIVYTDYKKYH